MDGVEKDACEALLTELMETATAPERVYSHAWRAGDVLLWDNRATMHRATPFDAAKHLRSMWSIRIADTAEL
jgi:alpha-ketoglutarate-dependent 2,4-dichlorophenoxyacetate dioxygenase